MSDENKPQSPSPEAKVDETPVIDPGPLAHRLIEAAIGVEPLGFDASAVEMIRVPADLVLEAGQFVRDSLGFDLVVSVTGVDWKTHRESVYHLFSTETFQYLTFKVLADAEDRSPSLHPIWPAVDWHERESYDLMGICYEGHPDLRRILMPDDWLGHPLRKDYKEDDPRLIWNRR